jgi:glycosyltransferase involved in cell wall biosynthesis
MRVTAVLPAYNEAGRVGHTVRQVAPYVDEVLVIDDGSRDATACEAEAAGARVIRQGQNQGYIAAIKTGFAAAAGDIVVTIDADGEFAATNVPALIAPIVALEADMVQGRRSSVPRPSERALTFLAGLRAPVGDSGTGLRALRTDLARELSLKASCICGIFALEVVYLGGTIKEVPIYLQPVDKPRKIAWFHMKQFFYLLPWLLRGYPNRPAPVHPSGNLQAPDYNTKDSIYDERAIQR